MAYKVGGTEVISNARALNNITAIDSATATAIGNAGVGGGSITATASGAISAGDPVVLNTNGTVSAVSGSGLAEDLGNPVTAYTGNALYCFDCINEPVANKIVIAYSGSANYGTLQVGTVSGTSISYGTAVTFSADTVAEARMSWDETNSKIVIIWRSASPYYLKARTATVSGTSITLGTTYTLNADETTNMGIGYVGSGKHLLVYTDNFTDTRSHVITVSGTAISSGSQVQYSSQYINWPAAIAWDSGQSKALCVAREASTGVAKVATISGTSVSFGTDNNFLTNSPHRPELIWNPDISRLVLVYGDGDYGNFPRIRTATISGTSVTLGTPLTIIEASSANVTRFGVAYHTVADKVIVALKNSALTNAGTYHIISFSGTDPSSVSAAQIFKTGAIDYNPIAYDDNTSKIFAVYKDSTDSGKIKAVVIQVPYANTNLTLTNFLGFSNGAYSNAATATIDIVGALNTNQSGLTIGQRYYVEVDGTLQLSPSYFAPDALGGLAVTATQLIVKG